MAKWKLSRQTFGTEELNFSEGDEVTIGRGLNNTITLSSIVISRNHCVIHFKNNGVMITDLKSSNGIYVGLERIAPNIPYKLQDSDVIGFGWTVGAPLVNITDSEKYIFKLTRVDSPLPMSKRIQFQNQDEFDDIEAAIASLDNKNTDEQNYKHHSDIIESKGSLKRKLGTSNPIDKINNEKENKTKIAHDVINILSDSDIEICTNNETEIKRIKIEHSAESKMKEDHLNNENADLQYEAFTVKQEYLGYDDEIQQVDSDSDSESEHWFLRLSQSSPGKPFTKIVSKKQKDTKHDDSSYSQADDFMLLNLKKENNESEEEFSDDCITIPQFSPVEQVDEAQKIVKQDVYKNIKETDPVLLPKPKDRCLNLALQEKCLESRKSNQDEIDSNNLKDLLNLTSHTSLLMNKEDSKKIQMIEPLMHQSKKKNEIRDNKRRTSIHKSCKRRKSPMKKKEVTVSQKEERKKKLKEIASKEKECTEIHISNNNSVKPVVVAKVTTSNRGAFLTNMVEDTTVSQKKSSLDKTKDVDTHKKHEQTSLPKTKSKRKDSTKHKPKKDDSKLNNSYEAIIPPIASNKSDSQKRIPLKSVKPLKETNKESSIAGKPFSKVEPLPLKDISLVKKSTKKVHFTDEEPVVHLFEIEPGNKMKRTSLIKTSLLDVRHLPVFSLEKITLMKILGWNPHWLDEQVHNNEPPPLLGHNNPPMAIFHSFTSHKQYIQLVGDLLLMEIWECLTQGYKRQSKQHKELQMKIDSLPPIPPQERFFDLFSLSVNISVPTSEVKNLPRVGDILLVTFGSESVKYSKFLFVHNVRCLPSPPNNIHSFFTISLYATYTEKMGLLRPGEIMYGRTLAYINKELLLFEAMEHLAGSPLSEAILRPKPHHFECLREPNFESNFKSQWTTTLNPSQRLAVCSSVTAALGDKPSIQMVQGPPGTGKSSVICAIVMTYFYNAAGKKQQNRGKILICATSNAAVDELVIRLLNIRQSLPKGERFRMVRVGRAEAMHPRARDVSSQQLAQRDAARVNQAEPSQPGLAEELRSGGANGGGDGVRPEQVAQAERRIIEGADIIVTTLASAHNHKMKGLRRRIALCIVDEAGQAIEPETLIPLTLDVTRITLIGDPQQLPGFICSQRAKKYGLGESLFSRLTSTTEHWSGGGPVVLLNQQYRMHPDIADYPNRAFYDGRIQTMTMPLGDLNIPPYTIISIASGDKGQGSSGANEMEAWGVARLAAALSSMLRPKNLSLAVITPYSAHRDMVRRNLRLLNDLPEYQVEVNTVDSFQGQERDVVVVSLARSHGVGFLTDAGRMNVMLTRAKRALFVCLNPLAMTKNHQWRTLVDDAHMRKVYKVLPNKMCQSASSSQIPHEEVLKLVINLKSHK
ncbi:uncharacterized protein Setx isoform X2 [Battus philenor]|uniref:uncharacterized protein Setx isoform X2 n=1 Tax=Battus philenor TaxID=42288 RepID=UPI0035CEF15D